MAPRTPTRQSKGRSNEPTVPVVDDALENGDAENGIPIPDGEAYEEKLLGDTDYESNPDGNGHDPESGLSNRMGSFATNDLELQWMNPYDLVENPLNHRTHPQHQRRALHTALAALGWLQPLLWNRRTGRLIDGHLRRQEAIESGVTEVPVLVVDLDEAQERAALASVDTVTGFAGVQEQDFSTLLRSLRGQSDDLLAVLVANTSVFGDEEQKSESQQGNKGARQVDPHSYHLVPGEQYNYVMLLFRTDLDWNAAVTYFEINEPAIDFFHNSKVVGRTRVIDGAKYLKKVLDDGGHADPT